MDTEVKDATEKLIKAIEVLADKITSSIESGDALKFTQSALNAAHTISVLKSTK